MRLTDPEARRRLLLEGETTGIDAHLIEILVRTFYTKVKQDPVLGPIFAHAIDDWEPHLERMMDFWSSVILMSGRYKGNPMAKHAPLELQPNHFDRWLSLFYQTAEEICSPAAAALFLAKARMIAQSLELAAAIRRGELPGTSKAVQRGTEG